MEFNKYLFKILLILFCLNIETSSLASSTKIVAQVEDSIISSYELKNKIKIILFLSKQNLSQENINLVKNKALRELIDYKLKENQIIKFNIQNTNAIQVDNYLQNLSSKYETDINGIKKIFKKNNLDFELFVKEIQNEFNWQKLIFQRFNNKISIDENEVSDELNRIIVNQKSIYEYKLAEIELALKNNLEDKNTILEVNNEIKKIGFEKAAIKYSLSSSSIDGGNLGWISSKSLSEEILLILDKMKIGDISKPIIKTNTATILKLLDKKTLSSSDIDLNKLRQKIIKNKKNELLGLYSNNYLSKIKNNALIEIK